MLISRIVTVTIRTSKTLAFEMFIVFAETTSRNRYKANPRVTQPSRTDLIGENLASKLSFTSKNIGSL